ncbi:MAG: choice-of-anchor L domain-containing protein [Chitinophagaceae bacterium]|nr:choice-of-anchor L domain-containing protein [Bacteroidota bacterium]MCC6257157.1 choice-of-anchor L domain-containing protein [Chitinophagaceae bacterium]
MLHLSGKTMIAFLLLFFVFQSKAQMTVNNVATATALAQKLVGDGISISNVTFTGNLQMTGIFTKTGPQQPLLDSGIVLTTGFAKTLGANIGVNNTNGNTASNNFASKSWGLNGDANLASALGLPLSDLKDACVLEFDFVPIGDSVRFKYVFGSEEYDPIFACSQYNDAFAFFISGPGITGLKNIALVPNTNQPVSISTINQVYGASGGPCFANTQYYVDNTNGRVVNYDGLTKTLVAREQVIPCQTYHLKLVISDVVDGVWDSGVFLEARSLESNVITLQTSGPVDASGNTYVVEGCTPAVVEVRRQSSDPLPATVMLAYGGTALNGIDIQTLPDSVIIPANDSIATLNVSAIADNLPEGIEQFIIYTLQYSVVGCNVVAASDSIIINIHDQDTLLISPDTIRICRNSSTQFTAPPGFGSYQWSPAGIFNDPSISNPIAHPVADSTNIICIAANGTCESKGTAFVYWKMLKKDSVINVNCAGQSTGTIFTSTGPEWNNPQFTLDGGTAQGAGVFTNLPVGNYVVEVSDASMGCTDSLHISIIQQYPDLQITGANIVDGGCTYGANGTATITATGGNPAYQYSSDGTSFQNTPALSLPPGTYTITVKDQSGCLATYPNVVVTYINSLTLALSSDTTIICEGTSTNLHAQSNAATLQWLPAGSLNNPAAPNVVASPIVPTMYQVIATLGICQMKDSIFLDVNAAPHPNAGPDQIICFGGSTVLGGTGGVSYMWTPATYLSNANISDPDVNRPQNITYQLHVVDANGCSSLIPDDVKITLLPPAQLYVGNDTVVAVSQPLQLHAMDVNHTGFTSYTWEPAQVFNNPNISSPVAILTNEFNTLIVYAETPGHCVGTDTIKVRTYVGPYVYVPSAFTPNGDGTNDVLRPILVGMKRFEFFRVYNRYGQLMFSTSREGEGWDGMFKGKRQGLGTFVWMVDAVDYKGNHYFRKGTTTIVQ